VTKQVVLAALAAFVALAASSLAAAPASTQRTRAEIEADLDDVLGDYGAPTLGEALQILELEILLDVRENTAPPPGPREK